MPVKPVLLALFVFGHLAVSGQSTTRLEFHGTDAVPKGMVNIADHTSFYKDISGDTLSFSDVKTRAFKPFHLKGDERATKSDRSLMVTWLKFEIANTHVADTLRLLFHCGVHQWVTLYENDLKKDSYGFNFHPDYRKPYSYFSDPIIIPPNSTSLYYVKVIDIVQAVMPVTASVIGENEAYIFGKNYLEGIVYLFLTMSIMCGCYFFMMVYSAYYWYLTRQKDFLLYSLYAALSFWCALRSINVRFLLDFLPLPGIFREDVPSATLLTLLYALFVSHLIDLKKENIKIWRFLEYSLVFLLLQHIYDLIEGFQSKPLMTFNTYYLYKHIPAMVIMGVFFVLVLKSKSPLRHYLTAGVSCLMIFAFTPMVIYFYVGHLPMALEHFVNYMPFWTFLGLTAENFWFAFALAYKGRLVQLEKNALQMNYTSQLKTEIENRTMEIEVKNREMEKEKLRSLEISFEQKIARTEMIALRAQMSPHFIFNSLNSIKLYAAENNGSLAAEYLTKFSKLIRLVLENSKQEKVALANELDALRLYMEMERLRFKAKLEYQIRIDEEAIEPDFIEIPPMLVQPYVENAIWHGLMHKPDGGSVIIDITLHSSKSLQVRITDNGIGREKALELKSKSATHHKSFGMKMTSERIQLTNQLFNIQTEVVINDLLLANGEPGGTEVILIIPF